MVTFGGGWDSRGYDAHRHLIGCVGELVSGDEGKNGEDGEGGHEEDRGDHEGGQLAGVHGSDGGNSAGRDSAGGGEKCRAVGQAVGRHGRVPLQ